MAHFLTWQSYWILTVPNTLTTSCSLTANPLCVRDRGIEKKDRKREGKEINAFSLSRRDMRGGEWGKTVLANGTNNEIHEEGNLTFLVSCGSRVSNEACSQPLVMMLWQSTCPSGRSQSKVVRSKPEVTPSPTSVQAGAARRRNNLWNRFWWRHLWHWNTLYLQRT